MSIDHATFRTVLSAVPTSVVVVTGMSGDGSPLGATIGSFTSVSLDPPLVGFLPAIDMAAWQEMRKVGKFCVNVLSVEQEDACWAFASNKEDRFDGIKWKKSPAGMPLIDGSVAWIDCDIHSETELGDHYFVAGLVTAMEAAHNSAHAMVFYRNAVGSPSIKV